jgi:hypothetical protein
VRSAVVGRLLVIVPCHARPAPRCATSRRWIIKESGLLFGAPRVADRQPTWLVDLLDVENV